jgi:SAM-dependent methyltransferase
MARAETIAVYDSQSREYHQAFQVFLDHTDQKLKAQQWLSELIDRLSSRRIFIDAGAGNGKVTAWFIERFGRTIAIEPNASLRHDLERACPTAELIPEHILNTEIGTTGDLILCSHVFYYIDASEWPRTLARLASWLAPGGVLLVVVQNHNTDCMKMLDHFRGRRFLVSSLVTQFHEERRSSYDLRIDTTPAKIETPDFPSAYVIAEFMLNLLPIPHPPAQCALADYVRTHFERPDGSFRFSCDQDFIQIRKCD